MSKMSNEHRMDRPLGERDHVQGPESAPLTLVLYGDYECPYTARTVPIVKRIQQRLGPELRFAFRYFPLNDIHPHAQHAAEAAEAAAAQGKFWEMHETLFRHFHALDDYHLVGYASDVGLEVERFEEEMAARLYRERVLEDFRSGERSGVESTPTFYINGVRYDGENETDDLLAAIEGARTQGW